MKVMALCSQGGAIYLCVMEKNRCGNPVNVWYEDYTLWAYTSTIIGGMLGAGTPFMLGEKIPTSNSITYYHATRWYSS